MTFDQHKFRFVRNAALRSLDIEWARALIPGMTDEGLLIGLHQARCACADMEDELREESAEWLRAHDGASAAGMPPPAAGQARNTRDDG
jgi:hypothetical protein